MKYFMGRRKQIWPQLINKKTYLFLDYDGTLAPLAPNPDMAVLPPKTRAVLIKLSQYPSCVLAIISGRALADIKKMVKIPGIIYSGNHGLEVDCYGTRVRFFEDARFKILLNELYHTLLRKTKGIKGILLENKKMTLALHYRSVASKQVPKAKAIFQEVMNPYQARRQVQVTTGKMVLEVRPPLAWGKGDLVKWLLQDVRSERGKTIIFYFGDDRTDEEAFKVVKSQGYAIIVGRNKRSAAEYYLKNPEEVRKVLEQIEQGY